MFKVGNPDDLPVVKTVYDVESLNEYTIKRYRSIVLPILQNPELESPLCLFKSKINGQYSTAPGPSFYTQAGLIEFPESDWEMVFSGTSYGRERPTSEIWAAYVLPLGVQPSADVYIEDVIEDIVIGGFWHQIHFAEDAIGKWTGEKIEIDFDVFKERYSPLVG